MPSVRVDIVQFVDEHQPGFVACELVDADGHRHTVVDKVPMFTHKELSCDSEYPQPGKARCEILARFQDASGRGVARITIARPDGLESAEGLSDFVVLASQVADEPDC